MTKRSMVAEIPRLPSRYGEGAVIFTLLSPLPGGRGKIGGTESPVVRWGSDFLFSSLNGLGGGIIVWVYEAALFSAFAAE